ELHLLSFAKNAAALFKKSRSIFSTRTSFRRANSSVRSFGVTSLLPTSGKPCSARFIHARSAVSVRSRSLATCPTDLPLLRTSATASALNSGVNDLLALLDIPYSYRTFGVLWGLSTKVDQDHTD